MNLNRDSRMGFPDTRFEFKSLNSRIRDGARDFYLKKPEHLRPANPCLIDLTAILGKRKKIPTATKEKTLAENSKGKNREKKFLPKPIIRIPNNAL